MKRPAALLVALLSLTPRAAHAQDATTEWRGVVFADVGFASTWDDEGLLGRGASVSGGAGYRLTPRLTIQAIVERIPYHRDVEWLAFDGRVLFAGVEAAFQSANPRVRPLGSVGIGMMDDSGTWTIKQQLGPGLSRVEELVPRDDTLAAMTASGGVDVSVTERLSIRTTVRFHGLLDTGDDLAPHIIIQPGAGVAWRW